MGQSLAKIERDFDDAVNHFKKAITVYNQCNDKKILDSKMIKNFCETILACFQLIPVTSLQDEKDYFKELIVCNSSKIGLTLLKPKIIHKYSEKFDDYSLSSLLDEFSNDNNCEKHVGTISRNLNNPDNTFVFIEKEDKSRFYANMYDFLDIENKKQWENLENGQLVSFEIGSNPQGECAKNIKIV